MLSSWLGMHSQLWTFPCSTKRSINLIYWLGDLESSVRGKQKDNLPNTSIQLFSDVSFTMSHIVTCILYWKMAMKWHGVSLYGHWTIVRVYSICKPTFFSYLHVYIFKWWESLQDSQRHSPIWLTEYYLINYPLEK